MRWRRRNNRKALKALVLSFAAMAIFAGNATAAQVHDGGSMAPTFESITMEDLLAAKVLTQRTTTALRRRYSIR